MLLLSKAPLVFQVSKQAKLAVAVAVVVVVLLPRTNLAHAPHQATQAHQVIKVTAFQRVAILTSVTLHLTLRMPTEMDQSIQTNSVNSFVRQISKSILVDDSSISL